MRKRRNARLLAIIVACLTFANNGTVSLRTGPRVAPVHVFPPPRSGSLRPVGCLDQPDRWYAAKTTNNRFAAVSSTNGDLADSAAAGYEFDDLEGQYETIHTKIRSNGELFPRPRWWLTASNWVRGGISKIKWIVGCRFRCRKKQERCALAANESTIM